MGSNFSAETVGNMKHDDALHSNELMVVFCASLVYNEKVFDMKRAAPLLEKNIGSMKTDITGKKVTTAKVVFYHNDAH